MPGFRSSKAVTIASYALASAESPQKPKLISPLSCSWPAAGTIMPRRVVTAITAARQDAATRRCNSDPVLCIASTSFMARSRRQSASSRAADIRECTRTSHERPCTCTRLAPEPALLPELLEERPLSDDKDERHRRRDQHRPRHQQRPVRGVELIEDLQGIGQGHLLW